MDFCLPSFSPGKAREFPEGFQLDGEKLQCWLSHCPVPASSPRKGHFLHWKHDPSVDIWAADPLGKPGMPRAVQEQQESRWILPCSSSLPAQDPAGLSRARGGGSKHFPLLSNNKTAKKGVKAAPEPFLYTHTSKCKLIQKHIPSSSNHRHWENWILGSQTLLCPCSSCSSASPEAAIPKGWAEAEGRGRWDRWRLIHLQIHLKT